MAIFHSPKIVTDGLIFYIDAQNTYSYSINDGIINNLGKKELETTFKELEFVENTDPGTPPSASTTSQIVVTTDDNIKSFFFDGTDYYFKGVGTPMGNIPNNLTYTTWINHNRSGPLGSTIFCAGTANGGGNINRTWLYVFNDSINMAITDGTQQGFATYTAYTETNYPLDFNYVVTTCSDNDDGNSTIKIYVNADLVLTKTVVGVVSGRIAGTDEPDIARGGSSGGQRFSGKIASASIYNKCLSQDEILRNYDAMRSRFKHPPRIY
tara:strand:+ start:26 stop:826 length:801 start_codon:yes stop_codon:yes gene_type:complete